MIDGHATAIPLLPDDFLLIAISLRSVSPVLVKTRPRIAPLPYSASGGEDTSKFGFFALFCGRRSDPMI